MNPGHPKSCPVVAAAKVRENISNQNNSQEKDTDVEMVCFPMTVFLHLVTLIFFLGVRQRGERYGTFTKTPKFCKGFA